jgi:S-formylglutathione hydrolase FrmB
VIGVIVVALLTADGVAVAGVPARRGVVVRPSVVVLKVASPEPGTPPRQVWVWRPQVSDTRSLPVLYFLHGVPGGPGDPFRSGGLGAALDRYLGQGGIPFVVASPDGNSTARADTEWADSADGRSELETFVVRDVIPAVEGRHRRNRAHRAIAGFSMGGYGAANIALRHPDLFAQTVPIAGYFHVDDPSGVFGDNAALRAANSPDAHVGAARNLRIFLLDDDQEDEPAVQGEALRFKGLLDAAHVPAELRIDHGSHDWDYVATQYPEIFSFLESYWSTLPGRSRGRARRR